ncbi:unnamed protein product [Durusdinium trenchii]|uniref:Uncharacterized protein n=2 Tax=Durusdinium trenchii TaxID=1381693 RepID=A0ABP0MSC7_9DINO
MDSSGSSPENSSKRYGHVSIVDGFGRMWIHGGTHGATVPPADQMDYIELDAIDLSAKTGHYGSWTPVQTAGTPPAARTMHSAVTDGFGGMWIFGGLRVGPSTSPSEAIFNDVQYFDFEGKNWTQIECAGDLPTKRFGHSAVLTSLKHMWIFGGQGEPDNFEALAYLNLVTQSWFRVTSKGTAPPSLLAHASVLDAAGRMWVLGGQASPDQANGKVYYLDTSLMQNTEWKMLEEFGSAPLPRIGGRAVIETSGKLWGFGGTLGPPRDGTFPKDLYWLDTTGPAPTTATSTTTRHPKDPNPNSGGSTILVIVLLLVAAALIGGGVFFFRRRRDMRLMQDIGEPRQVELGEARA